MVLIGALPPPYGGVSIHVQRLRDFLVNNGFQCRVIDVNAPNEKSSNILIGGRIGNWQCILNNGGGIIHIHSSGISFRKTVLFLLVYVLCRISSQKLIITFHSFRDNAEHLGRLTKAFLTMLSKHTTHYVAVSQIVKSKLVFLNVDPSRISVIPAFLPPIVKQQEIDMIPQETWNFIDSHRPVISANAFQITFYNDQDLYGIDMCVDLCAKLRLTYPQVGFVFCLSKISNHNYFNRIKQKISENGTTDNFAFVTKPCQFYPILMRSDLFVRPTNTDGDAVSLREALCFQIPTVASDIIPRPKGVVTFRNRNFEDFVLKVQNLLDNYRLNKRKVEVAEMEQSFRKILSLYEYLNG